MRLHIFVPIDLLNSEQVQVVQVLSVTHGEEGRVEKHFVTAV